MTSTLHLTESEDLDAKTIEAFAQVAKEQGKTPEQLLAEVITTKVNAANVRPHPYQNANS
jgi:hypothetical protein